MPSAKKTTKSKRVASKKKPIKQSSVKKAVKKVVKKSSVKKAVKKVVKKSSVKKAVKKVVKKVASKKNVVKKANKSAPLKKIVKKSLSKKVKKTVSTKKSQKKISVCKACLSSNINEQIIGGDKVYVCAQCGYKSPSEYLLSVVEVKKHLEQKKVVLRQAHLAMKHARITKSNYFFQRFNFRVFVGLVGIMLLITGIIFVSSEKDWMAIPFLIAGIALAFTGERL